MVADPFGAARAARRQHNAAQLRPPPRPDLALCAPRGDAAAPPSRPRGDAVARRGIEHGRRRRASRPARAIVAVVLYPGNDFGEKHLAAGMLDEVGADDLVEAVVGAL